MKIRVFQSIPLLLAVLLWGPAAPARAQFGPAEQVGRALENAGRNIRRGVQNAIDATRGVPPFTPYIAPYENPLVGRIEARLLWEKLLAGSTVELEVRDDGTAVLRGVLASKEAKERAFLLTRDTIGVSRVIDETRVSGEDGKALESGAEVDPKAPTLESAPEEPGAEADPSLEPIPAPATAPPATGPAARIRVRPGRAIRRGPVGSTTVIIRPPSVPSVPAPVHVPEPVEPAPAVEGPTPLP